MPHVPDFCWPRSYLQLREEGWFDPHGFNLLNDPAQWSYLWLGDIEWMSLDELRTYGPGPGQSDRLTPFAYTGAHDWWGFYLNDVEPAPVTLCLHDDRFGTYYAPTFEAALFRLILDFASQDNFVGPNAGEHDFTLERARAALSFWQRVLARWFPREWVVVIRRLASVPFKSHQPFSIPSQFDHNVLITPAEALDTFRSLVPWDVMDSKFLWQDMSAVVD